MDRLAAAARDTPPARRAGGDDHPHAAPDRTAEQRGERLVGLSMPEVRELSLKLVSAFVMPAERVPDWSVWWGRHQHTTRACHYKNKKRGAKPPD